MRSFLVVTETAEWFPTVEQRLDGVDDEGRKIFEAHFGRPIRPADPKFESDTYVKGFTNDDDARTVAQLAVDHYNKNKEENQLPLQLTKVVGAVLFPTTRREVHYLITFLAVEKAEAAGGSSTSSPSKFLAAEKGEAAGGSNEPTPSKFFAMVSQDTFKSMDPELRELMPVDDDLTQLKDPRYKMRKEKKRFLNAMAAKLREEKKLFLKKMKCKLEPSVQSEEKWTILKTVSAELDGEMQFKEENESVASMLLQAQDWEYGSWTPDSAVPWEFYKSSIPKLDKRKLEPAVGGGWMQPIKRPRKE